MPTVSIPPQLTKFTGGLTEVSVTGDDLQSALTQLCASFPDLSKVTFDDQGGFSPFLGVFLDGTQVYSTEFAGTRVQSGSKIVLLSAIAGG